MQITVCDSCGRKCSGESITIHLLGSSKYVNLCIKCKKIIKGDITKAKNEYSLKKLSIVNEAGLSCFQWNEAAKKLGG